MMKQTSLLLTVLVLALMASTVQAAGKYTIQVSAGIAMPTGKLAQDFIADPNTEGFGQGLGYVAGLGFDCMLNEMFAIGADGSYSGTGLKKSIKDQIHQVDPTGDFTVTNFEFGVHGKYMFPMKDSHVSPYVVVGVGLSSVKGKFTSTFGNDEGSQSRPAFRAGLGAAWKVSPMTAVGIEGNYNYVTTDKDMSISSGVSSINWMDLRATLRFSPGAGK